MSLVSQRLHSRWLDWFTRCHSFTCSGFRLPGGCPARRVPKRLCGLPVTLPLV